MILFKDKFNKSSQPSAVGIDLFQSGVYCFAPQNDLADMVLDLNRDRYQIYHDEKFKVGTSNFQGTGNIAGFQFFANNDFKYNCEFYVDCTKFLPKTITYNDASSSPMSDTLGCCSFLFKLMAAKWPPLRLLAACPGLLLTSILMLNCLKLRKYLILCCA